MLPSSFLYTVSKTGRLKGIIAIKNKKELIANFSQVFHPGYKAKVKAACTCNLFNNYQGVMLGNGEVWINERSGDGAKKTVFKIIAINNSVD